MTRRRSAVERAMQRAHGLPDGQQDDGWREGANGTRYQRVELQSDAVPTDKSTASLYLSGDGTVTRHIRVGDDEVFA